MKYYNRSKLPDGVLRPLLTAAARAAGLRPIGDVIVQVAWSRSLYSRAWCGRRWARLRHLNGKRSGSNRKIYGDGHVIIRLRPYLYDPLECAKSFYKTAVHEFAHIADGRAGKRYGDYNKRWANRPHEQRAIGTAFDAMEKLPRDAKRQDLIISLGIAIEEYFEKRNIGRP